MAEADAKSDESHVDNSKELDKFIKQNAKSLVLYHSSDCKNCEEFRASFQEVISQLQKSSVTLPHASIDCKEFSSKGKNLVKFYWCV